MGEDDDKVSLGEVNRNLVQLRTDFAEFRSQQAASTKDYVTHDFLEEVRQSHGLRFSEIERDIKEIKADRRAITSIWIAPLVLTLVNGGLGITIGLLIHK